MSSFNGHRRHGAAAGIVFRATTAKRKNNIFVFISSISRGRGGAELGSAVQLLPALRNCRQHRASSSSANKTVKGEEMAEEESPVV